ncbi:MAG: GNAT family N-acetyltransferase [Alphaproteobacteria bacterium]|nr:GNAT family N-acetyltransferase [Alphaproteobacteria bacterium]
MDDIMLSQERPTVAEYIDLRRRAGWGTIDEATAARTLAASAFSVCLRRDATLVGFARVIGDGVLYFFLADLIVDPSFRGGGHGDRLMRAVTDYYRQAAKPGAMIALIALKGREAFYERFGYVRCPDGPFGDGMHFAAAPSPVAS